MKTRLLIAILLSVLLITEASAVDCNLPYGDPNCSCCSESWGGGPPPELAYVIFQGIERTDCDPNWIMLPPPNNRLFRLRLTEKFTGNTCAWSYNLDVVGGEGGRESDIWIVNVDLTAYYGYNVYLANTIDDKPADMFYFYRRGFTDCRTIYTNELDNWDCGGTFFYFWAGGTARIFWFGSPYFGEFNGDGIVNFKDFNILTSADPNTADPNMLRRFAENWLVEFEY